MQHGKQTGGAGSCWPGEKRWPDCCHRNLVAWITLLECCDWWLQTIQKGQAMKERWGSCSLCWKWDWLHRAVFEEQQRAAWELLGENQRLSGERKLCGWCLLQATWSRRGWWRVLSSAARSNTLAGPYPDRALQSRGHLLEKHHSELQVVQETTGVCWGQLPSTGDREPEEGHCWTCCSLMQKYLLDKSRLEVAWTAKIMPWWSSQSWGVQDG